MKQYGYQKITGLNTVKSLTVPSGARFAMFTAEAQAVRWLDTGADPTASTGHILPAGGVPFVYQIGPLTNLRFIENAASATLHVTYYG